MFLTTSLRAVALATALFVAPSICLGEPESSAAQGVLNPETQSPGLEIGDPAPNATVMALDGEPVELADLYGDGVTVVTFYRGGWCPWCLSAMKEWNEVIDAFDEAGIRTVFISAERLELAESTLKESGGLVQIASDVTGEAARAFRVAFMLPPEIQTIWTKLYASENGRTLQSVNATGTAQLPSPATFVIDQEGVIRWRFADWDYKKRADPAEVLEAATALAAKD